MQFAQWYDGQPVATARVVNFNDRVPHLFQSFNLCLVQYHTERSLPQRPPHPLQNRCPGGPACSNSITSDFSNASPPQINHLWRRCMLTISIHDKMRF
ncbi:hypothetical protein DSO57_1039393 [Entomophthora muscae]|uniref:Uncharacterized protein n=1 Tax=Entomophthora muscae TaxID=34485 RepID=A0ACC2RD73_9FUNG|nr:hypothetical protein DSO57_1039393 [Entomophthora muscae]